MIAKLKGYRVERKIRLLFEKCGWTVLRAGASLGEADLICLKDKKCILLQIKSTKKKKLYYYGYTKNNFQGFPFFLVVDFGYKKVRVLEPIKKVVYTDGQPLDEFLKIY